MLKLARSAQRYLAQRNHFHPDLVLVGISLVVQIALALFFGHAYDMRVFMASGYLVGTGQNPYIPQDLASVFHDPSFSGITSIGYPPPWSLVLGLLYFATYKLLPSLLLYNLAIKLPIIAANICLAYLVAKILNKLHAEQRTARKAWLFMLFNPLLLFTTSAWGQFDSIVALFSLLALVYLSDGKLAASACMLALAIAFKPTALPLVAAVFVYLLGSSIRPLLRYFGILTVCTLLLFIGPFILFGWDATIILQHWNAHFTVGGGLTFMTVLELVKDSYQLADLWWLFGLLWVPGLVIAAYALKASAKGLLNLLRISTVFILVFFLLRSWVSEPNIILVLPLVLILTCMGDLNPRILTAVWVLPLVFSFFNTSLIQILFPSMPALMERLLQASDVFRTLRLVLRSLVVVPWLLLAGWVIKIASSKSLQPLATIGSS